MTRSPLRAGPATSDRIRDAGVELFSTRGFAGTGIRDIANHVGVTTSTLYHHLAAKDDLLDLIISGSLRALNGVAAQWSAPKCHGPARRLAGLVTCHVIIHATNRREVAVIDRQLDAMRPTTRREALALRDSYEAVWRAAVVDGAASGAFAPAEPTLAARALLGATTAIADWYRPSGPLEPLEVANTYTAMAFDLVAASQPPPAIDPGDALDLFTRRWETT